MNIRVLGGLAVNNLYNTQVCLARYEHVPIDARWRNGCTSQKFNLLFYVFLYYIIFHVEEDTCALLTGLMPLGFGIFNIIGFYAKQEKLMILQGDTRVGDSERNGPRRIQWQFMQP